MAKTKNEGKERNMEQNGCFNLNEMIKQIVEGERPRDSDFENVLKALFDFGVEKTDKEKKAKNTEKKFNEATKHNRSCGKCANTINNSEKVSDKTCCSEDKNSEAKDIVASTMLSAKDLKYIYETEASKVLEKEKLEKELTAISAVIYSFSKAIRENPGVYYSYEKLLLDKAPSEQAKVILENKGYRVDGKFIYFK